MRPRQRRCVGFLCVASLAATAALAQPAPALPSFDCHKAVLTVDKLICSSPPLAALDRGVAGLYKGSYVPGVLVPSPAYTTSKIQTPLAPLTPDQLVSRVDIERAWLRARDASCLPDGRRAPDANAAYCLEGIYRSRLNTLMQLQPASGQDPSDYAQLLTPVKLFMIGDPSLALVESGTYIAEDSEAHVILADVVHMNGSTETAVVKEPPGFSPNGDDESVCLYDDSRDLLFADARQTTQLIAAEYGSTNQTLLGTAEPIRGAAIRDGQIVVLEGSNGIDRVEEFALRSGKLLFSRPALLGIVPVLFWNDRFVAVHPDGTISVYGPKFATRRDGKPQLDGSIYQRVWDSTPQIFDNRLVLSLSNGTIAVIDLRTLAETDAISLPDPGYDYHYAVLHNVLWIIPWRSSADAPPQNTQQPSPVYLYDLHEHRRMATLHVVASDIAASGERLLVSSQEEGIALYDVDATKLQKLEGSYAEARREFPGAAAILSRTGSVYSAIDEIDATGLASLAGKRTLDPQLKVIAVNYASWLAATLMRHRVGLQLLSRLAQRYPSDADVKRRYAGALLFDYLVTNSKTNLREAQALLSPTDYPTDLLSRWQRVGVDPSTLPVVGPTMDIDRELSTDRGTITCATTYGYQQTTPDYYCKLHERRGRRVIAERFPQNLTALVGQAGVDQKQLAKALLTEPWSLGTHAIWTLSQHWVIQSEGDGRYFGPEYTRLDGRLLRWRLLDMPVDRSTFRQALILNPLPIALVSSEPTFGGDTTIRSLDLVDNSSHITLEVTGRVYGSEVPGTSYVLYGNSDGSWEYLLDGRTGIIAAVFRREKSTGSQVARLPVAAYGALGGQLFQDATALMLN